MRMGLQHTPLWRSPAYFSLSLIPYVITCGLGPRVSGKDRKRRSLNQASLISSFPFEFPVDTSTAFFYKPAQVRSDMIANSTECRQAFFFRAVYGGGVGKTEVNTPSRREKNLATLLGVVTNGDYIIETLPRKFLDRLGAAARNVNRNLPHDLDGFRVRLARMRSYTKHFLFEATARAASSQHCVGYNNRKAPDAVLCGAAGDFLSVHVVNMHLVRCASQLFDRRNVPADEVLKDRLPSC